MVNWESNVFPGILGRTCDRPCEPACRRGRVEEEQTEKPEPVAICRLKRVAADYKGDIAAHLPHIAAPKNGKRIACIGAGPASLTVARDLAPLGYEVVVFDGDAKAGGMIRTQIPRFRLPETVIDEETGYILDLGVEFRFGHGSIRMKALLREGFDAVFVGSRRAARPRPRHPRPPGGRGQHPHRHRLARPRSSFGHVTEIGKRVIVLGGGNTAMDCCRTARRLGGEDVKVIVRSRLRGDEGLALGEGGRRARGHPDPRLPRAQGLRARERQAGRRALPEGAGGRDDDKGRRKLVPTGEPERASNATTC